MTTLTTELSHDEVEQSTGTPTSLYLADTITVGVVLVSRDQGPEAMSDEERTKIIQEVQAGLDWLASVEHRARLSFVYDIRPVTVNILPGPYSGETNPYERFESGWRDAALQNMGYSSGRSGYQEYVNDLRTSRGTKWAYVAFFTKYPLNHFAYAIWEKVVMEYKNDNWGPDNIHRVFAHESCHIFGAADEYGNCSCGGFHGFLGAPNNNCVNCSPPGTQVECLMNQNTTSICEWSRKQIGWDTPVIGPIVVQDATVQQLSEYFPQTDDHQFHVAAHRWARNHNFVSGVPCHEQLNDLRGIICIPHLYADIKDATVQQLSQYFPQDSLHHFHVAAHRWAQERGYVAGVPCHEQSGDIRGIICIKPDFAEVRDATVEQLSQYFPQDSFHHYHVAAHRWARDNGFIIGIPCHEQSGEMRGIICIK